MPARRFDPWELGTPERDWATLVEGLPGWDPPRAPLVVVTPHPDDETLGAGGLIACWGARGWPVHVVVVTDGEAAPVAHPDLAGARWTELQAALTALGASHARVTRLGLPDGDVASYEAWLAGRIVELVPPPALLVGPYARDGHPDHEGVARACRAAAAARRIARVEFPVWAWHHAEVSELARERLCRFHLDAEGLAAKRRALDCYRSQLAPERGRPVIPPHVLPYFHRADEVYVLCQ